MKLQLDQHMRAINIRNKHAQWNTNITSHRDTWSLMENPLLGKRPPFLLLRCSIYIISRQENHCIKSAIWKKSESNYGLHLTTLHTPIWSTSLTTLESWLYKHHEVYNIYRTPIGITTLQTPILFTSLAQHPLELWRILFSILVFSVLQPQFFIWFNFHTFSN